MSVNAVTLLFICLIPFCFGGTINTPGTAYTRWPSNIIPFKYMSNDAVELAVVKAAADQISFDTGGCVNFTLIPKELPANQPHLVIQNRFSNPNTNSDICFSYPGYTSTQGVNGQVAVMFSQTTGTSAVGGCLDNIRDAMRILMNAIGVRNEYQRKDRSDFMTFPTAVDRNSLVAPILQRFGIFNEINKYNDTIAINAIPTFDKDSVTMVSGTRFAGTSTPVFSTVGNGVVGQQSRLSRGDCLTVRSLYSCNNWYGGDAGQTSCGDPYSSAAAGISLTPSPAILTRTLHCATTTGGLALSTPLPIGQFVISGLQFTGPPTTPPTIGAITSSIPGLQAELVFLLFPVQQDSTKNTPRPCPGGTADVCIYSLRFSLNRLPTTGVMNQQVTVRINQGTTVTASLIATINLNCAPVFQSITANVGYAPALVSEVTFRLGAGIDPVPPPSTPTALGASVFQAPSGGGGILSKYLVNYYMPKGFGDTGTASPNSAIGVGAVPQPPRKVYVNCIAGATANLAGTTVIGSVTATDPEGGQVSYYAYSGAAASAGELHTVSKDGIISISAIVSSKGVSDTNALPGAAPNDPNGGAAGAALPDTVTSSAAPTDVFIVAVDSLGAASVLEARFFLACGEVVA